MRPISFLPCDGKVAGKRNLQTIQEPFTYTYEVDAMAELLTNNRFKAYDG